MGTTSLVWQLAEFQLKAAEDSRTPRRWRAHAYATPSARFGSAAVLCRFSSLPAFAY
jgi:hypothetical protein